MDLNPTDDQLAFVSATTEWCRDMMPLEQARARPENLWQQIEAMGWLGMTAPNFGLDHATEMLVFAELGRFLAPVGMIATAIARRWSGETGNAALALLDGAKVRLIDPADTVRAICVDGANAMIATIPADIAAAPGLDLSAPLAIIDPAPPFHKIDDHRAALHLQLLSAAFTIGCAETACDTAAEYAKLRHQFDRPIGWFQAIKHICADMAVRAAVARSQLYFAACALDSDDAGSAIHIAAAKRLADQAALENARANIQVHGGIGMTDEASPHLLLKRAHLLAFVAPAGRETLLGEVA